MLVSQAEAGLDGSNIQQGQKCARATLWGTFVWLLPPSPTGWRFVLFMLSQNQPWIPPCQCTNIASAPVKVVFPLSACTHWLVDKFCFVLLFFFLVKMRLPVFFTVTTLPWICIFVFLFFVFFCSLSQTRNRRLPDIYPQYCSSHHPQPDSHSLQGKM